MQIGDWRLEIGHWKMKMENGKCKMKWAKEDRTSESSAKVRKKSFLVWFFRNKQVKKACHNSQFAILTLQFPISNFHFAISIFHFAISNAVRPQL